MQDTTFTPHQKLIILGQTIPTNVIKHISPMNSELDYPDLSTFNIGNITITLHDPDGHYNPNNPDNFWTQNHYQQSGNRGAVEIQIGVSECRSGSLSTDTFQSTFHGQIANIRANLRPPEIIIEALDATQNLRPTRLDDFGTPRRLILTEDTNANNNAYSGRYPFPESAIPSNKSVNAQTNLTRVEMTDVGTISTEGTASPLNYQVANNTIETEGGPLWTPETPLVTYKDAYRYKRVDTLVRKILEHYGITDYEIDIDPQETDIPHFASHGRPGFELENQNNTPS